MASRKKPLVLIALVVSCVCAALFAQEREEGATHGPYATADELVGALYGFVTFKVGTSPDWDKVKSLFLEQAVVVLRTARDKTTVFDVDGFVADFVRFAERADVKEKGFTERIIRTKTTVFGEIAHVLVLYEASIPGSDRPPQQGVDSFQLIQKDGHWWIVSITNEIVTKERPLPAELRK